MDLTLYSSRNYDNFNSVTELFTPCPEARLDGLYSELSLTVKMVHRVFHLALSDLGKYKNAQSMEVGSAHLHKGLES